MDDTGTADSSVAEHKTGQEIDVQAGLAQFTSYIEQMHRTGVEKLNQMMAEVEHNLNRIQLGVVASETTQSLATTDSVPDQRIVECADPSFHGEHDWHHPTGEICRCPGQNPGAVVLDQTVQMASDRGSLENAQGYPRQRIFVISEERFYEWIPQLSDGPAGVGSWEAVDDGQSDQHG